MKTVRIKGALITDEIFSIETPDMPELHWNITRIQSDADRGLFGPAEQIAMTRLPPMTDAERANIDNARVATFVQQHREWIAGRRSTSPLLKPTLSVCFWLGPVLHRCPVDGNHRICARQAVGMSDFLSFVVPEELEGGYRVTFEVL